MKTKNVKVVDSSTKTKELNNSNESNFPKEETYFSFLEMKMDLFKALGMKEWGDLDAIKDFFFILEIIIDGLTEEQKRMFFKKYYKKMKGIVKNERKN